MTEYDYSPEAFERFHANQRRVSDWVSQTRNYPGDGPSLHSSSRSSSTDNSNTFSSSSSSQTTRQHYRSHTTPAPHVYLTRGLDDDYERGRSHHYGDHFHPHTRHRSPSPYSSSSATTYRDPTPPRSYSRPHPHIPHPSSAQRAYSHPVPFPRVVPAPYPGYAPAPAPPPVFKVIDSRTGRTMPGPVVSGPRPVVVPGNGRRGQTVIVLPQNYRVATPPPRPHHSHRHKQQPFLKRLFGSIVGSSHDSGSRRTRRSSY